MQAWMRALLLLPMLMLMLRLDGGFSMADDTATEPNLSDPQDFDAHWKLGNPAKVGEAMRAMLPDAAKKGPEYHAMLLTQIARTAGLQGDFAAAHEVLDEADAMLTDDHPLGRVRSLLERGRAFNSAGKKEEATKRFHEALRLGKEIGADFYAIDAAHMLAISVDGKDVEWNLAAIEMAEASKHKRSRGWLASLCNNMGWSYFEQKDYATALKYFERALEVRREHGHPDGIARWCVAKAYRMLGRLDDAMSVQRALEKEYAEQKREDGFVFEEIGELLWAQDKKDEARPYLAKAYRALKEMTWVVSDDPARVESLRERAGLPKEGEASDGG